MTLVAVVEHGSMSAAARALSYSVASVSTHVSALEKRLGVPLVTRTPQGCEPTRAGSQAVRIARLLLAAGAELHTVGRRHHGTPPEGVRPEPAGRVLIVGGSSDRLDALASLFPHYALEATICTVSTDVLDTFHTSMPGLVLVDCIWAGGWALRSCHEIRAMSDVPIVALVRPGADADEIRRTLAAGADDFVSVPSEPDALLVRLAARLRAGSTT